MYVLLALMWKRKLTNIAKFCSVHLGLPLPQSCCVSSFVLHVLAKVRSDRIEFGCFEVGHCSTIVRFQEKPVSLDALKLAIARTAVSKLANE
jgi:hypothetical protein